MNKKALLVALIYSILVVIFKLIIWQGGYTFSYFGFNYSHITSIFLIIPFLIISIKWVRDSENNGVISGRDAMRMAAIVVAISAIILTVYNYVEFKFSLDAFADYYKSETYMDILKRNPKAAQIGYQKIIDSQISELSPFKAATGKLFPFILLSLSGAFICAVFMKKNPA